MNNFNNYMFKILTWPRFLLNRENAAVFSRLSVFFFLSTFFLLGPYSPAAESVQASSSQRIKDFYLSNFKEDGSRDWEVKGEEAFVHDEYIDINQMEANYYSKDEMIFVTSDEAKMIKKNMNVYLKNNVYIENKKGMSLSTDSLEWQRDKNYIKTNDWVKTNRDSMQITAEGMFADTQLEKINFEKNVKIVLPDKKDENAVTASCVGPLEIEYNKGKAVFNKEVVIVNQQGELFCDKATLFFDTKTKRIAKIIAEGNVKIIRDGNITYAQKATYLSKEQKVILVGRPRLIYFPSENNDGGFFSGD